MEEVCDVGCANIYTCEACIVDENNECVDQASCYQACLQDEQLQQLAYCAATAETCEDLGNC